MGETKSSFFSRLKGALGKTREKFSTTVRSVFALSGKLGEQTTEMLTEALIAADVGPRVAARMAGDVEEAFRAGHFENAADALLFLKEDMKAIIRALGSEGKAGPA